MSVSLFTRAHTHLKKKKKKKKFAPVIRVVDVSRRVITYGIRAGSTRDLGFATAFTDRIRLIILLLIDSFVCVHRIQGLGDVAEPDDGVLRE
jgi:hypothetical protein